MLYFLFYQRVNWMECRQFLLFCIHTIARMSHKIFSILYVFKTLRSILAEYDGQPPRLPTQLGNHIMSQNWDVDTKIGIWSAVVGVTHSASMFTKCMCPTEWETAWRWLTFLVSWVLDTCTWGLAWSFWLSNYKKNNYRFEEEYLQM